MKRLRNKKTGKIGTLYQWGEGNFYKVWVEADGKRYDIKSLAELNTEWEDVEESKDSEYYWYIGYKNDIRRTKYHHISDFADNQVTATRKEIGNCFESLEEAELAVEKLKAWKRLKDKGFKFEGWDNTDRSTIHNFSLFVAIEDLDSINKDLDLLFSGEDD